MKPSWRDPDKTWYERIVQAVGDVLSGRRYWRQRSLILQYGSRFEEIHKLTEENRQLRERNKALDALSCEYYFQIRNIERQLQQLLEHYQ